MHGIIYFSEPTNHMHAPLKNVLFCTVSFLDTKANYKSIVSITVHLNGIGILFVKMSNIPKFHITCTTVISEGAKNGTNVKTAIRDHRK